MEEFAHLWEKLPQVTYPASTPIQDLPQTITRKCCPRKTCGTTDLYLKAETLINHVTGVTTTSYKYLRCSNDDVYFSSPTVEALIEQINDEEYWPDRWSEA